MGKVLDLRMLGVQELGRDELKEVDGGSPLIVFGTIAAVTGIAVGWVALCDKVNAIGKEIGAALAK